MFMAHGWLNATGFVAIKGKELNVMFAGAKWRYELLTCEVKSKTFNKYVNIVYSEIVVAEMLEELKLKWLA